ncbi:hypothetical protein L218DRAFT_574517 [Marasmius fiardii PR-910]|nr:hypothetical protein L218DRAFT_574517 [Marasmius fiardii PR-910]
MSPLHSFIWLCWTAFVLAAKQNYGQHTPEVYNPSKDYLLCWPVGDCEPCPRDVLNEPFCQPFGTRRLMDCFNDIPGGVDASSPTLQPHIHPPVGEKATRAWQPCGRIVNQERADFFEFVACNVVLAIVAILIVLWRTKRMHMLQTRQLAARIGRIRG